jgi:hypothetical protein
MNSRGGYRRSGSLPPITRVSMSRPSIGCGPQRVPSGAPVDNSMCDYSEFISWFCIVSYASLMFLNFLRVFLHLFKLSAILILGSFCQV